jgi:hypothetical protein
MDLAAHYRGLFDPFLASHKWLICADAAVMATPFLRRLADLGAPRPLVLAGQIGTGETPDPGLGELLVLDTRGDTIMGGLRAFERAIRDLPDTAIAAINRWDPKCEALVLASSLDTELEIEGRPTYGGRPEAWAKLEDKTTVDALWDDAGVTRAPSVVVPAERDILLEAAHRNEEGAGSVWVADNREGWHGGAEYLRHVTDDRSAMAAVEFMVARAGAVRIMPFIEGIPCSIHGIVFPDRTLAFRPVEQLIYRIPGTGRFQYAGVATWWDPAPDDREYMRRVARRVGDHLRDRVGYRGAFTVDGVMSSEGFRPTELNARLAIGLLAQARGSDPDHALPLGSLNRALIVEEPLDYRPDELEGLIIHIADTHRQLRGLLVLHTEVRETETVGCCIEDGRVVEGAGNDHHGDLRLGPSALGGLMMFSVEPGHAVAGPSAAPTAASAFRLGSHRWGTAIEHLVPADPAR